MLVGLLCVALAIIALCPDTPLARQLRRVLIDAPANWLAKLTTGKVLIWSLVAFTICVVLMIARDTPDAIILLQAIPETLAWLASLEVSTYLEIVTAIWLTRMGLNLRAARHFISLATAWLRRIPARIVRVYRNTRRKLRRPPAKSDDEDAPAYAFA